MRLTDVHLPHEWGTFLKSNNLSILCRFDAVCSKQFQRFDHFQLRQGTLICSSPTLGVIGSGAFREPRELLILPTAPSLRRQISNRIQQSDCGSKGLLPLSKFFRNTIGCFGPAFLTRSYTQRRVMDHGMRHGMHLLQLNPQLPLPLRAETIQLIHGPQNPTPVEARPEFRQGRCAKLALCGLNQIRAA